MPAEALLLGIAAIAAVVAGFTAVTSTLVPPGGAWHPAMRIRQRAIVSTSFNVMLVQAPVGVLLAAIFLGEKVGPVQVAGGLAILVGAALIQRGPKAEGAAAPEPAPA